MAKPPRTDFSDKAKKARGIDLCGPDTKKAEEEARHAAEKRVLRDRIAVLETGAVTALDAFNEGRRGDGLKILNALVRPIHGPKPGPKTGGEAA